MFSRIKMFFFIYFFITKVKKSKKKLVFFLYASISVFHNSTSLAILAETHQLPMAMRLQFKKQNHLYNSGFSANVSLTAFFLLYFSTYSQKMFIFSGASVNWISIQGVFKKCSFSSKQSSWHSTHLFHLLHCSKHLQKSSATSYFF